MNSLFLSIVIPVYNREDLIVRCLDSILAQDVRDVEIICIDDASTDGTREIVEKYQEKYNNISLLINKENRGVAYVRNRGIDAAKGEYIWFVDSDDYIADGSIHWLMDYFKKEKVDIIAFEPLRISDRGEVIDSWELDITGKVVSGIELFRAMYGVKRIGIPVCAQVYSRDYLRKNAIRFTEGYIAEDTAFSLKALITATNVVYINKVFYIYQLSSSSTHVTYDKLAHFKGFLISFGDVWDFWCSQKWPDEVSKCIISCLTKGYLDACQYYETTTHKDLEKWIGEQSTTVKSAYLFIKEQCVGYYLSDITDKQYARIKMVENIYVYGAGKIARDLAVILNRMEKRILAYIVSDHTTLNPKAIYGVPVVKISELDSMEKDALVLVATMPRYHDDIMRLLEKYEMKNVLKLMN